MTSHRHARLRQLLRGAAIAVMLMHGGCATWKAPTQTGDASLRARATTKTNRGVQLSATVLSSQDSVRIFGTDVNAAGVQPVWFEVVNDTTHSLWLMRSGTDPDYFSPLEVAWSAHVKLGGKTNEHIDEHFNRLAFPDPIPSGQTRSGFLFTNPQPITKVLNVDLLGDRMMIPFTLLAPVPGQSTGDYRDLLHEYARSELERCDDDVCLRKAIEKLPCCATSSIQAAQGEPLNVVGVGKFDDIASAVVRRGYRRDIAPPAATQQLFNRGPDLVLRKRAQAGAPANWLRVWRAPIAFRDQPVFVVQAGRPLRGRFAQNERDEHIHADVDEVRNSLIQDFLYSGGLERFGFATGVGAIPAEQPRSLPDKTSYYTDGLRAVLFFAARPLTMADVEVLDWEPLPQAPAGTPTAGASRD